MNEHRARFVDRTGYASPRLELWPAIVIPREDIEAEVERLAGLPAPENGRRRSLIVHPRCEAGGGLTPGIRVSLDVLKPGEQTKAIRHSSSQINFCIRGEGFWQSGSRQIAFQQYDVWNTPSMSVYECTNRGKDLQVRLTYSNATLLENLRVHYEEEDIPSDEAFAPGVSAGESNQRNPFGTFKLSDGDAYLMPYEKLINPDVVESRALHWPWREVKHHLDRLSGLGESYVGRRLYLLYNPASGRANGTTHGLFATMTVRPPRIVDRPHRHAAAAINYYFAGAGRSTVDGKVLEWKAGDLMMSAPGLAVHNHASYDQPVYELTIQDSPLHINMDSLLWQESLKSPMVLLGSHAGFNTNRDKAASNS